ncbi:MAG TPA: hypothetical protein VHD33_07435 [Legionellaceae bacterium]|nr:hypothetical protein [Legionellaceae bacterium]
MLWTVPAKTFLVGEYAALRNQSAIILNTAPHFELKQIATPGLQGIHPDSPAGRWWSQAAMPDLGLVWHDPYQGLGGLGASSAQFLCVYQAWAAYRHLAVEPGQLLDDYQSLVGNEGGLVPSGYDVLAQYLQGHCVYLNRQDNVYRNYIWPFKDLSYILIHTQQKLATHTHLKTLDFTNAVEPLAAIVEQAKSAFDLGDGHMIVEAINHYHELLHHNGWVAAHTLTFIERIKSDINPLAIKGCGAMGADVILIIVPQSRIKECLQRLIAAHWLILTSSASLH